MTSEASRRVDYVEVPSLAFLLRRIGRRGSWLARRRSSGRKTSYPRATPQDRQGGAPSSGRSLPTTGPRTGSHGRGTGGRPQLAMRVARGARPYLASPSSTAADGDRMHGYIRSSGLVDRRPTCSRRRPRTLQDPGTWDQGGGSRTVQARREVQPRRIRGPFPTQARASAVVLWRSQRRCWQQQQQQRRSRRRWCY